LTGSRAGGGGDGGSQEMIASRYSGEGEMKSSMKIRAHEAEVLVVGADEEQTAEIIRIMLQGCTAEVPSRLLAEVPRRLCAGALALPATTTPRRCPWCWLPYRALAGKLCGRIAATAPALTTAELPSISSLRDLAGGTM